MAGLHEPPFFTTARQSGRVVVKGMGYLIAMENLINKIIRSS